MIDLSRCLEDREGIFGLKEHFVVVVKDEKVMTVEKKTEAISSKYCVLFPPLVQPW